MDIKKLVWKLVEEQGQYIVGKYPEYFKLNTNSEYVFFQKFDEFTEIVKSNFMKTDIVDLDRHKVAAIIICSIVECSVLKTNYECNEDELFDGNEKIAVNIGLSYMRATLIKMLDTTSEKDKFVDFYFPKALMCDTDYITILCRNLYYARKNFILNPLEIANTLFLLENISLIKSNIDLEVVRKKTLEI